MRSPARFARARGFHPCAGNNTAAPTDAALHARSNPRLAAHHLWAHTISWDIDIDIDIDIEPATATAALRQMGQSIAARYAASNLHLRRMHPIISA